MFETLSGIEILIRLLQLENARSSMLVTLFGIVILVMFSQFSNALSPMIVTSSGITTDVTFFSLLYFFNTPFFISNPIS